MRYLEWEELIALHVRLTHQSGGSSGLRDAGLAESALAQPKTTFGGQELYPSIEEKAAALCFSLVSNHPFVDGNKRIGHAAMEVFLVLNGFEMDCDVDEAEGIIQRLAAGRLEREELTNWIKNRIKRLA
jgi:death-on-curing protein